jgi:hypothetical protein
LRARSPLARISPFLPSSLDAPELRRPWLEAEAGVQGIAI